MADLITLAQARTSLRIPAGQIVDDGDLTDLITAATVCMEDLCGPILPRDCDEWHDGGSPTVRLLHAPITAVTSVIECYGAGYNRTLTEQDLDAGTFTAFGYTVDLDDGLIVRRVSGAAAPFIYGRRNIHTVYTAGRASVPVNLQRATRRLVRWLWQTEMQGNRPANAGPESATTTTPSGYSVPTVIKVLCGSELRVPGMA